MRKLFLAVGIIAVCVISISQEIQHEAVAINIEVPVRVFKGDAFIDNLSLDDFELYEDGLRQELLAVYLIEKTAVQREQVSPILSKPQIQTLREPETKRQFILVFEVQDWLPKLGESIDYFFKDVIAPNDSLITITPRKTYSFNSEALKSMDKQQCADQLKSKLRKDIVASNALYHSIVRGVIEFLHEKVELDGDFEMKLMRVHNLYEEWMGLKYIEEVNLLKFAEFLKTIEGQKHVFLFYQREVLPQFSPRELQNLMRLWQSEPGVYGMLYDLFVHFNRDVNLDETKINSAFSDASISNHFLYLTKIQNYEHDPTHMLPFEGNISLEDKSVNVYNSFRKLADATGGITEASSNASFIFRKAVDASENYYLLYYTPKDYKSDGRFRNIKVKVKGKNYRVLHRAGYLAD